MRGMQHAFNDFAISQVAKTMGNVEDGAKVCRCMDVFMNVMVNTFI